ncbi:MAG: hypothetical protein AMXMBFR46_01950 [Acidimicrobiia bacterium]
MTVIAIGTALPPWGTEAARAVGGDEDAVTLAVDAGRAAIEASDGAPVARVVLVTRDLPLLDGGNGAALVAGLGLPAGTEVVEQVGGAPAALDQVVGAATGTLVIGADTAAASGAAAALIGTGTGLVVERAARVQHSLPVRARGRDGVVHDYDDPRLVRERGVRVALAEAVIDRKAVAVAGLVGKDAAALSEGAPPAPPTTGASAPLFALAALAESVTTGLLLAFEQASMTGAEVSGGAASVARVEPAARPQPKQRLTPGPEIKISLPAYERAFEAKLRLEAGRCPDCGTLALPQRFRCLGCGSEGTSTLVALPREAVVYTTSTIHTPVPGLATPYTIVIAELGDTGVRLLARITGADPGSVAIGDRGTMVLRRVADRSGVPDYGYAFLPDAEAAG